MIALLYRRHGENAKAQKYIDLVLGDPRIPENLRVSFLKMKKSINTERDWQRLAVEHFRQAVLSGKISGSNQPVAKYLIGELYRRLERADEARYWFNRALKEKQLPVNLKKWMKEYIEVLP